MEGLIGTALNTKQITTHWDEILRLATSIRAYGTERIPREGGAVLAMNHFNFIDVPVFGTICPRRLVYVAKSELFEVPGLSQLIAAHGTLAIRRGESDRDALRRMRQAVRENEMLGLFVEGTRQTNGVPGEVPEKDAPTK